MNIAVVTEFGYPDGVNSNVGTEGRLPMSYALLLAQHGHKVDVVLNRSCGVSDKDKPSSVQWLTLQTALQNKYDICIAPQDSMPVSVRADKYIVSFFTNSIAVLKYQKIWEERLNAPIICVKRNNIPLSDAELWAYPIFTQPADISNFDKKSLLWIGKHNPPRGHERYASYINFVNAIKRHRGSYAIDSMFVQPSLVGCDLGRGMNYNVLLQKLPKYKMTLTHYYGSQSLMESVLSGCLPVLWENHEYMKGGDALLSIPGITLFDIQDSQKVYENKLERLLSDREYFEVQWSAFMREARMHLPDESYSQWLKIIS
jgi:hypothetical protein